MKKIIILLTILFFAFTTPAFAHPGRTAGDGCHYCRTNCDSWGEAWGERHCHGGGYYPPPTAIPQESRDELMDDFEEYLESLTPTPEPTPIPEVTTMSQVKNFTDFMFPFVGIGLIGVLTASWVIKKVIAWVKE